MIKLNFNNGLYVIILILIFLFFFNFILVFLKGKKYVVFVFLKIYLNELFLLIFKVLGNNLLLIELIFVFRLMWV